MAPARPLHSGHRGGTPRGEPAAGLGAVALGTGAKRAWQVRCEVDALDRDNHRYLGKLLDEVGWVEAGRSGFELSYHAYVMALHRAQDWPLMLAVTAAVETGARAKRFPPELFVVLHQRTRYVMGERDRYGQVGLVGGRWVVGPLEDRARVDEFRKGIGLGPLAAESRKYEDTVVFDDWP